MKLEILKCTCGRCGASFDVPFLGEAAYGEFILRSKGGGIAYLNAFVDATYTDVDNIISVLPSTVGFSPIERAEILTRIYGRVACDPDKDNNFYELDSLSICSFCESSESVSCKIGNPPELVELNVPEVTHDAWFNLTEMQKIELVVSEIDSLPNLKR
jgi:hypothetical protein